MKNSNITKSNYRKPLEKIDTNTIYKGIQTPFFTDPNKENKNPCKDNIYENLLKKTQYLQKNLEEIKGGFNMQEKRERSKSFFTAENTKNEIDLSDYSQSKLVELNNQLMKKNNFLTNKIQLMEEREQLLLKTISQLRMHINTKLM